MKTDQFLNMSFGFYLSNDVIVFFFNFKYSREPSKYADLKINI